MCRKVTLAIATVAMLGGGHALAKTMSCTVGSLERTVELRYEESGESVPCEVRYAKPTESVAEQVLWRAEREEGYCEARFEEFADRLRGFGWSCGTAAMDTTDESDDIGGEAAAEPATPEPEAAGPEQAPTTE